MAEKEKKNTAETTKNYRISLNAAKHFAPKKRAKRAMGIIRDFVRKNTRIPAENVNISKDLNEAVWERGARNIPNKLDISVLVEAKTARVFLKESKEITAYIEEKKALKKKKEEKEAEKKKEEKSEKKEVSEQEKTEEQKLEEKKLKEKYSEAIEIKRK